MSFHILHIFKHGGMLSIEHGCVLLKCKNEHPKRMPIEDIRAVVIAARGISISSNFLSAVTKTGAIILHCDDKYRPCGITSACSRVIDPQALQHQVNSGSALNKRLWRRVLKEKIANQAAVLSSIGCPKERLLRQLISSEPNEADAARFYWKYFFPKLKENDSKRGRFEDTPINHRLNYGYAVLSALCHRSIIIHGLSPLFGIHHVMRYQAHALVYDVMEPLRPWVDRMLISFLNESPEHTMAAWAKHVANQLKETKIPHKRYSIKLLDALDVYLASMAECFAANTCKSLWVPVMSNEESF